MDVASDRLSEILGGDILSSGCLPDDMMLMIITFMKLNSLNRRIVQ